MSLEFVQEKEKIPKYIYGILAEKFYSWKAWMFITDMTEDLLKIRAGKKEVQSYCPYTLKSECL